MKKTKTFRFFYMILCIMLMTVSLTACDDDEEDKNPSIVGTWELVSNGYVTQMSFNANGSCFFKEWSESNPSEVDTDTGRYTVNGNTLSVWWESEADEDEPWTCTFKIEGNRMTTSENGGTVWIRK